MAITRIGNIASTIPDDSIQNVKMSNIVQSKNIIINGDMSIAQRGTSETGVGGSDIYLIDRFQFDQNAGPSARFTMSQDTDVPSGQGFSKSLKLDCTTAQTSYSSNQLIALTQKIEGQNVQYLKYGTSSAQSLTLSFWVKSNKTGTYTLELDQDGNSKDYSQTYTISSANTWEKKTLTYVGDTASALANDNSNELDIYFWLGAASDFTSGTLNTSWNSTVNANRVSPSQVNIADSTSNEWYVTGVQLEAGTTASEFEFLPYDVNLQRCERYFYQAGTNINGAGEQNIGIGQWYSASEIVYNIYAPTTMRTKPSLTTPTVSNGYRFHKASSYVESDTAGSISDAGNQILAVYKSGLSGGTGGQATFVVTKSSPAKIQFSAEL